MSLTGTEVAEQLRRAIRGEISVKLTNSAWTWASTFAGDVQFDIGGWLITFFNDCDELDYCDSAIAEDGRTGEFDQWWDAREEPTTLLSEEEFAALERMLESAA